MKRPFVRRITCFPRGFTLIELMIAIAVAAVLLGVAVPAMRDWVRDNKITTTTNDFLADLSYARSEAMKRNTNVGLCPSSNGSTCATTTNWSTRRLIFVDTDDSATFDSSKDQVIQVRGALDTEVALRANASILIYARTGGLQPSGTTATLAVCDERGASEGRSVALDVTGRASISSTVASCTP